MTARVVMLIYQRVCDIVFFGHSQNDHSPGELISVDANSFCKDAADARCGSLGNVGEISGKYSFFNR